MTIAGMTNLIKFLYTFIVPKKPAPININLIPKDPFFSTPVGKVLQWALSVGRYIVIFTELIVILSFLTRFNLDRQVTDLNESIFQKKTIIESYGTLEQDVRLAQQRIEDYLQTEQQGNLAEVFPKLTKVTPYEIRLEKMTVQSESISMTGSTLSQRALNLFSNNLQLSPDFDNIEINNIKSEEKSESNPGYEFGVNARVVLD